MLTAREMSFSLRRCLFSRTLRARTGRGASFSVNVVVPTEMAPLTRVSRVNVGRLLATIANAAATVCWFNNRSFVLVSTKRLPTSALRFDESWKLSEESVIFSIR